MTPISPIRLIIPTCPNGIHLSTARTLAPPYRFPPGLRAPAVGERRLADRLRVRKWLAASSPRPIGIAQGRRRGAAESVAATLSRGLSAHASRDADRNRPGVDPAQERTAQAR